MLSFLSLRVSWSQVSLVACLLVSSEAFGALDLRPGLKEEWRIRSATEDAFLDVEWTDSVELAGGAVDWTAVLTLRRGDSMRVDTAVLRRFALTHLVETGEFLLGETWGWIRPSCLMPFQRDLDSAVASDVAELPLLTKARSEGDRVLRMLPRGVLQELCAFGGVESDIYVYNQGEDVSCWGIHGAECDECAPAPRQRDRSDLGTVGWRSTREGKDWRLLRFDGRTVDHPPGRLAHWPRPGESWTWTQGASTDPPLRTLTILASVPDSAGVPGWEVSLHHRDAKGKGSTLLSRLRIDFTESLVQIGSHRSFPWALSPISAEANFALGFVRDWANLDHDTIVLFESYRHTSCMGNAWRSSSTLMKAARDKGVVSLKTSSYTGPFQSPTFSSTTWTLTHHSLEPTGLPKDRSTGHEQNGLRQRLVAEPGLRTQWISPDGRSEVAHGLAALKFLKRPGVSVLIVGEGPQRTVQRTVRP